MRYVHVVLIAVLTSLVLLFKFQNLTTVTVSFLTVQVTMPVALMVGLVYVLGMVSGGAVVSLVRTLVRGAQPRPESPAR